MFLLLIISNLLSLSFDHADLRTYEVKGSDVSVYFFLSETCPICINLTPEIKKIEEKYGQKANIELIFPNAKVTKEETVNKFKTKYQLKSKVVIDAGQLITDKVGATITPEVFVIDNSSGRTIYSGMISDEYVALGKRKRSKINHILDNVLNDYFNNNIYDFVPNKAIGCFIIRE